MENISKHIFLKEVVKSYTATRLGIDNTPTIEHLNNLKKLAEKIYEPLRKGLGEHPIFISCGYRGKTLNDATPGSSSTSYHCSGKAFDLDDIYGFSTNKDIFLYILKNLQYAELIWEFGDDHNPDWVHVAYDEGKNVKETLRCKMINGKRVYSNFNISEIK